MRVPIGVSLQSRDGTLTRDPKLKNCIIEPQGVDETGAPILRVRKRPGMTDLGLIKAGAAQLLYNWNGIKAILGDYLNSGTVATIVSGPTQTNLTPTNAGLQFSAQETGPSVATPRLMIKNRSQAWTVKRDGSVTAVTYGGTMGSTTYNVTSVTRSGTTATVTLPVDPGFNVGDSVTIAGATPSAYNGAQTITAVTPANFTPGTTPSISSLTRVGTLATAVATAHGLTNGSSYAISGANQSGYNGTFAVTVLDANTFTYTVTLTGSGPDNSVSITALTRSGSTATATAVAHGLSSGTYTISGATQTEYNGSVTITVTDSDHFTYPVTATIPAVVTGTLSSSDKDSHISLSSGNLKAAWSSGVGVSGLGRGTVSKSSGVWMWEVKINALSDGIGPSIGIAKSSTPTGDYPGQDANSYALGTGTLYHSGPVSNTGHYFAVGDVIGVVLNFSTGILQFYQNGTLLSNASFSGVSGTFFPVIGSFDSVGWTVTANFSGALVYDYSTPKTPATGSPIVVGKDPISPATGTIIVTVPAVTIPPSFTFTIGGSPTTPATGTITAQGTGGTVPGIPYIDGYFCVMDSSGVVWSSNQDDPTTWGALAFFTAQNEPGAGRFLSKSLNYLIAGKEWTTEFFYDAKNPTGSPFSPVDPGFVRIGCATGDSLADVDGYPTWVSQVKNQPGRSVHMLQGLSPLKISSPDVERVINADSLTTVYALCLKMDGHAHYILTLPGSNVSLGYDSSSKAWGEWSSLTLGTAKSVSSLTSDGSIATIVSPHGLSDGDPVKISGADQQEYNGVFPACVVDSETFTVEVPAGSSTSITPVATTSTWNPADKSASLTLSGGNLTASVASGVFAAVRGMQGKTASKWYWEVRMLASGGVIGVADASASLISYLGSDAHGWGYNSLTGQSVHSAALNTYGATFVAGDVIGVALDMDAGTLTFYKNGVSQGIAFSGISGTIYPAFSSESSTTETVLANFGATAFIYTPPTGYYAGVFTSTITITPYTESYFKFTKAASYGGQTYLLHESTGHLYQLSSVLHQDSGIPINSFGRSSRLDGGSIDSKSMPRLRVIGDEVEDLVLVRWSDDDCQTFAAYRRIDLSEEQPETRKCGSFRRRTLEFRHTGNNPLGLLAYEPDIK